MADQTVFLDSPLISGTDRLTWNVSITMAPALIEGGAESFLRRFRVFRKWEYPNELLCDSHGRTRLCRGPDFTSSFETEGSLTMSVATLAPVTLNSPQNPGNRIETNFSGDDPYRWRVPQDQQDALDVFFTAILDLFDHQRVTSLFLFDGQLPPAAPADIRRADAFGLTGRGKPIYAIEISHPSVTDNVLAVGDSEGVTLEGNAYPALGFRARLPQEKEGEIRQAGLEIDNVGRKLVEWVEASEGGRGAIIRVMEIVVDSSRDAQVVWEMTMDVGTAIRLVNEKLSVVLVDEGSSMSPAIKLRHDPVESPGLF